MDTRAKMRRNGVISCAGAMVTATLMVGCHLVLGIEDLASQGPVDAPAAIVDTIVPDASPRDHGVRGTATGVLGPVALELRLGSASELLTVTEDGDFSFQTRLESGASYTVVLAVADTPCSLENQTGVIAGADAAITLTCTGAMLESVVVSGMAPAVELTPGKTEYTIDVPLSQSSATVTAAVRIDGDLLRVAGVGVPNGVPSEPLTLNLGDNPIDIVVENDLGWRRTYRFTLRRADQLAQYAYAKASNTDPGDNFGYSIALSGDTLAVGAHLEDSRSPGIDGDQADNSAADSGAVYVFRRIGTSWRQEAYIKASNPDAEDYFGFGVALEGETLAVGAKHEDSHSSGINGDQTDNSALNSGAVYVFRRTGAVWQQEAYIKASNAGAGDIFGHKLVLSGDTLAVGAHLEDSAANGINGDQTDNSALNSGAVYVFRRTGAGWQQEAYIKPSNTDADDEFSAGLGLSGDTLAVSAWFEDSDSTGINGNEGNNNAINSGAIYVFRRNGASWRQEAYIKASNTGAYDLFGVSASLSGDTLAVGAHYEDSAAKGINGNQANDSARDSGAVYVFRRNGTSWQQEAYIKASNTGAYDFFGVRLSLADGNLLVGSFQEDSGSTGLNRDQEINDAADSGAAYVYRRSDTTWRQEAYVKASNTDAGDFFGYKVAVSSDTFAIAAFLEDSAAKGIGGNQASNGADDSGAVYIFH